MNLPFLKRTGILFVAVFVPLFIGCLATTNYYTGKTLPAGEKVVVAGFDYLAIQREENMDYYHKTVPFLPSFGFNAGLPFRLETGIRWYFSHTALEGCLRWGLTPSKFKFLDISINGHGGLVGFQLLYLKYGFTVSKDIRGVEPFFGYTLYTIPEFKKDLLDAERVMSFGIALPIPDAKLIPEINYSPPHPSGAEGILVYNIGLRVNFSHGKK